MKALMLFSVLLLSGCMSKYIAEKDINQPAIAHVDLTFEDLDLNEDGNVSAVEVKNFNEKIKVQSTRQVSGPIWVMFGIVAATVTMCVISALIKCNKSE